MNSRVTDSRNRWVNDIALGLREEFSLEHNEALTRAASLMDRIATVRPADFYYWPARSKRQRDESIAKEFNGTNMQEIRKRYNVSAATVYNIRSKALARRYGR